MSTADDETKTPPTAETKPRRPRKPRAKAADAAPPPESTADAPAETPAPKPKRAPAKPATRRAPARKAPARTSARTTARTSAASKRADRSAADAALPAYGAIAGAAGVGLALGLLAALGRRAAVQAPTALAADWASALAAEHQAALALFDRLEATEPGASARRPALLAQLKQLLTRHALQEENVVYPELRRKGWQTEADDLHARSGQAKGHLYELANSPVAAPAWVATLRTFRAAFEEQARMEDDRLFPALRGELSEAENKALASAMNREGFKLA